MAKATKKYLLSMTQQKRATAVLDVCAKGAARGTVSSITKSVLTVLKKESNKRGNPQLIKGKNKPRAEARG